MNDSASRWHPPRKRLCPLRDADWQRLGKEMHLSAREMEIVRAIVVDDPSTSEMARDLGMALDTVRTHLKRLYRKLQVESRVGITLAVFRWYVATMDQDSCVEEDA